MMLVLEEKGSAGQLSSGLLPSLFRSTYEVLHTYKVTWYLVSLRVVCPRKSTLKSDPSLPCSSEDVSGYLGVKKYICDFCCNVDRYISMPAPRSDRTVRSF